MYNGMQLDSIGVSTERFQLEGMSYMISRFDRPVKWNGWYFVTSESEEIECDPVRFALYTSSESADEWKLVCTSSYANLGGHIFFMNGAFGPSSRRGAQHTFDLLRERMGLDTLDAINQALCSAIACASSAAGNTHLGGVFIAVPEFVSGAIHAIKVGTIRKRHRGAHSRQITTGFLGWELNVCVNSPAPTLNTLIT